MITHAQARVNIDIREGVTFEQQFQWTDEDKIPVDLTGYTARMHVRKKASSATVIIELTTDNGRIEFPAPMTDGNYILKIPATATTGICPRHRPIAGVYDLQFILNDVVMLQQYGQANLIPAVTR
jgi:hypothetical protein